MLAGLAFFHSVLAINNTTTLDSMGGNNIKMPCLPDSYYLRQKQFYPNLFDKGTIGNICEFFDNNAFTWWYPTLKDITDEGITHSHNPPINSVELAIRLQKKEGPNAQPNPLLLKKSMSLSDFDYEEYLKKAEDAVNKKNVQFDKEIFEYGKRKDNSCIIESDS